MSKVHKISEIAPVLPFSEYDFYDLYRRSFEKSELGRIRSLLPLHEMAVSFGSDMRYPTDPKLLWEGIEKTYSVMCRVSTGLVLHRPRTKYNDVSRANMAYRKDREP